MNPAHNLPLGPNGESVTWHPDHAGGLLLYHAPVLSRASSIRLCQSLDELRSLRNLCNRAIADVMGKAMDADDAEDAINATVEKVGRAIETVEFRWPPLKVFSKPTVEQPEPSYLEGDGPMEPARG